MLIEPSATTVRACPATIIRGPAPGEKEPPPMSAPLPQAEDAEPRARLTETESEETNG